MKLSIISEAADPKKYEKQLAPISLQYNIKPEQAYEYAFDADPTDHKEYMRWILARWRETNFRLPEDGNRIKHALATFHKHKKTNKIRQKDIHTYKTIRQLEEITDDLQGIGSKRQKEAQYDINDLQGVEAIYVDEPYRVFKVTNADSLAKLGVGTKWCTREDYEPCQASRYLKEFDEIIVIYEGNKPYIQLTPDLDQVMDTNDEEVEIKNMPLELQAWLKIWVEEEFKENPSQQFRTPVDLALLIREPSQLAEHCAEYAFKYRREPEFFWSYVRMITSMGDTDPWPSIESFLLQELQDEAIYTTVQTNQHIVQYCKIYGRRRIFEDPMIKNGVFSHLHRYAIDVMKQRWPEYEKLSNERLKHLSKLPRVRLTGGFNYDILNNFCLYAIAFKFRWDLLIEVCNRYEEGGFYSLDKYTDYLNMLGGKRPRLRA